MIVDTAYKIEKSVAKIGVHKLDMVVWHMLRFFMMNKLPRYYKRNVEYKQMPVSDFTDSEVILSLTTYPKRMKTINLVIETLLHQTVKPTKIQLWLAESQYQDKESVINSLKGLIERGLEVRFCDDLKSHKKYYYSMLENPEAIVVTADDDILYPETMLERLLMVHSKYPNTIVAHRAHLMLKKDGQLLPYNEWNYRAKGIMGPDLYLCATGGAGVLYPPHSLSKQVFDKNVFKDICFYADDLWLKSMSFIIGTPVVLTGIDNPEVITIPGNMNSGLAQTNVINGNNDTQLKAVSDHYSIEW